MKKISLYIMALLATVFAGCSENDYSAPASPQSNPQESALQSSAISFTPANIAAIDLGQLIANDTPINLGKVSIAEGAMPANTIMKAKIDMAKAEDYSDAVTIDAESMANSDEVMLLPSNLQAVYYNNFTHNPNAATMYMRVRLFTLTNSTSEAIVGTPGENYYGNYKLGFKPVDEKGIYISTAYYAVVKGLDGSWNEVKCSHSDKDVYDDPEFEVTINALKDENSVRHDTEYYIVAQEDLAAFKAGNTALGFGQGEGQALQKGGPAFVGPATDGAAKYILSLNMEKQTIVIEPEIHFYCYYLLGNNNMKIGEGDSYKSYMFYKIDDTTFTYTTFIPNNSTGKSWLNIKVWDRDAMNAAAEAKAWGYNGSGLKERPESGSMKQSGGWLGPKKEGWYTMTIVMDEEKDIHNYQFTEIEAPTTTYNSISLIGTINGSNWDKDFDLVQCAKAPHNWCLLDFELAADAKLKFRANHEWNGDWGGDGSQPISSVVYTLPQGGSDIAVPAGKYDFYLNDITGDWIILKAE
jgi:hypothetical protein